MSLSAHEIWQDICADRSKKNVDRWIRRIIKEPDCLPHLLPYLFEDPKYAFRIGWLIETLSNTHPELVRPLLSEMYAALDKITFSGYKRSLAKIFSNCGIPEEIEGEVAELMFGWLSGSDIEVAVKVHSMQTLYNLTKKYPELGHELKEVIVDQLDRNTAAFAARGKRLLRGLE